MKALEGVVSVGKVAAKLSHGELPTIDETTAILGSIPGMSDVADITNMSAKLAKSAGQTMGIIPSPPDDGRPHTCWVKSHGRGFGRIPQGTFKTKQQRSCLDGKEMSGGLCYDKCPQGSGVGPVCWGKCPTGTTACGLLC